MGLHQRMIRSFAMLAITGLLLSSAPTNVPPSALGMSRSAAPAAIGPVAPAASTNSAPAQRPRGIPPGSFVPASLRATPHTRFSLIPPPAEPSSPLLKFVNSAASSEETGGEGGGEHHPAFYGNDDNPNTSWRPHPEAEGPHRICTDIGAPRVVDKFFVDLASTNDIIVSINPSFVSPGVAALNDTGFSIAKIIPGATGQVSTDIDGDARIVCIQSSTLLDLRTWEVYGTLTPPKDQGSPTPCSAPEAPGKGGPFNPRTGFLWTSATDLRLPTGGPPLDWTRTYVSRSITETTGPLGIGWQFPYNTRLITPTGVGGEPGLVIVVAPDGNRWRFSGSTDINNHRFYSLPGIPHTLDRKIKIDSTFLLTPTYELTTRQQQRWTYNNNGQLIGMQDAQGHQLTLTYTNTNQLERVADKANPARYLALSYTDDRITQVSDGVRFVTYTYTDTGDLVRVSDVMSRPTDYTYQDHLLTKITNALGQTVEETSYDQYTPDGRVITQTLLSGQQYVVDYQPDVTEITITGPDGQEEFQEYRYDESGTLTGTSVNEQVQSYSDFEEHLSPGSRSDANGNTTSTVFNQTCQPEAITNALGETTQVVYDTQNHPISITDSLGRQTVSEYDANNNLVRQTLGVTTSFPLGFTNFYTYTTDHRMLASSGPDGVVTRNAYDAQGQLTSRTIGYGTPLAQTSTYGYDRYGRVVTTTVGFATPLARVDVTRYNHDDTIAETIQNYKNGVFVSSAPDEDIVTAYGYDALGRPSWVRDVLDRYDVTHYDAKGRVDWRARHFVQNGWSGGTLPGSPPAYSASAPDRNVATFYGYDGLGRTAFVTETGILTGTFNVNTLQFSQATQRVTRTEFDTLNRPVTVTLNYRPAPISASADRNVQLITHYDLAGNVIGQRDALGRWTTTAYDALNRPITVTVNYENGDPLTVDLANQGWTDGSDTDIVSVTRYRPDGMAERTIDNYVDGVFTATQLITDQITLFEYDALSRPITTTLNYDPPTLGTRTDTNRASVTAYDPTIGRVLGQRDPLGRWVSQQYDLLGRTTKTIQNCRNGSNVAVPTGCATFNATFSDRNVPTSMLYDALGRTTLITDALSTVTRSFYDGLGRSTKTIRNYVAPGTPTTAITNVTTLTKFDGLGRTSIITDALGYPTRQSYNGLGQTTYVTDTLGRVTRMGYDGQGTLRWSKAPTGQVTVYQLDGLGRAVTMIANYQDGTADATTSQDLISRTVYDAGGRRLRQIQQTMPAYALTTVFAYDNQDRLITVTENQVTGSCTWEPCNVQTQYRYDRLGNRTAIVDARGNVRTFTFDAASQQLSADDPVHPPTAWTYDRGGRVTAQDDPRGSAFDLSYSYDNLDRRTQTSAGSSSNLATINASYNALGWRTDLDDGAGSTDFQFDRLGRMTRATITPSGQSAQPVGYSYNARSERTQISYPNSGPTVQYSYWPDGQLRVVTDTTTLASYAYDNQGRLCQVTRANKQVTHYGYDSAERLIDSTTSVSDTVVGRFEYAYNHLGLRTTVTETLGLTPTLSSTWMETGSFEAASLTDPVSGVDQVVGTVEVETAAPIKGAFSARVPNTNTSYLREDIADTDSLFISFYLRVTTAPGSNTRILQVSNRTGPSSVATAANIQLTTSRRLRLRYDGTSLPIDSAQLTLNTDYRVGVWQKKGTGANGLLAGYLAVGDAPFTSPYVMTNTLTFTTPAARVNLGASTGTAANIVVDNFRLDREVTAPPPLLLAARAERPAGQAEQALASAPAPNAPAFPPQLTTEPGGIQAALARLPLAFVPDAANAGAASRAERFVLQGMGGSLTFDATGLSMAFRPPTRAKQPPRTAAHATPEQPAPRPEIPRARLRLNYQQANPAPTIRGAIPLPGIVNDLSDPDPRNWRTELPTYAGLVYERLYDGIDLHYAGTDGQLKGTYIVAPGADPSRIRWRYNGAERLQVDKDGNLLVTLPAPTHDLTDTEVLSSTLTERAPIAWQTVGERETERDIEVPIRYVVADDGTVSFALGNYDRSRPLIIDPTIVYSTFLGNPGDEDIGTGIAVDTSGNTYVLFNGGPSVVTKLNPSGSAIIYTTALSGPNYDLAVDGAGQVSLIGALFGPPSPPFTTPNAFQTNCSASCTGGDALFTQLNASGTSILYRTFLGGTSSDNGWSLAVDSDGNAYLTGAAGTGFPTTVGAYPPAAGGTFVAKINPTLSGAASLVYSTILGASTGYGIALDSARNVYVTGFAVTGFPTKNAIQASCQSSPCQSAFVSKLTLTLTGNNSLIYSTYLGGDTYEHGRGIAVDGSGRATVVGETFSTDLVTTTQAFQPAHGGNYDAFVTRVNAAGTAWDYSSYLGGSDADHGYDVALDPQGNIYLTGFTESSDFPTSNAAQPSSAGDTEAFVTVIPADGHGVVYSSYVGGNDIDTGLAIAVDARGSASVTGKTYSANFPLAYPVQATYDTDNESDAYVVKLSPANRVVHYQYDGLLRLIEANEQPGATYAYSYDDAGNRTGVWVNGTRTLTQTHDAANQVSGWSYDAAGNLLSDGSATMTYDALSRTKAMTITATSQTRHNSYTGDGVLLKQVTNGITTRYIQDLAAPLSQVLQTTGPATTNHIYGLDRLASKTSSTRSWYLADALGSVRRTLTDGGAAASLLFYDPWGTPESGSVPTFGFTGELHDPATGMVNLRARWYSTSKGTFTSKDPFEGFAERPYSLHPYQYGYSDPVRNTDPSGMTTRENPDKQRLIDACSQASWQQSGGQCRSPYVLDRTQLHQARQFALWQMTDQPCIPYVQIEIQFFDGTRLCTLNLLPLQFGVHLDPGILALMMSQPTCLQPSFTIGDNGRVRLAAQAQPPDEEDESTPPESPKRPPTGPSAPPRDPKRILLHGSDEASVEDIIANGLNRSKARKLGGGDVLWAVPESEAAQARLFAQVNPSGGQPAILGIEISETGFASLVRRSLLKVDTSGGFTAYQITAWERLNDIVRFFRYA
jgi:RHS repeat-associated protein